MFEYLPCLKQQDDFDADEEEEEQNKVPCMSGACIGHLATQQDGPPCVGWTQGAQIEVPWAIPCGLLCPWRILPRWMPLGASLSGLRTVLVPGILVLESEVRT